MLTGTVTVMIWKSIAYLDELMYELIPGFLLALVMTVVVSLLDDSGWQRAVRK